MFSLAKETTGFPKFRSATCSCIVEVREAVTAVTLSRIFFFEFGFFNGFSEKMSSEAAMCGGTGECQNLPDINNILPVHDL